MKELFLVRILLRVMKIFPQTIGQLIINRPSVAGAVLQTTLSLINSFSDWLMVCENIFMTPPRAPMAGNGAFSPKMDYIESF